MCVAENPTAQRERETKGNFNVTYLPHYALEDTSHQLYHTLETQKENTTVTLSHISLCRQDNIKTKSRPFISREREREEIHTQHLYRNRCIHFILLLEKRNNKNMNYLPAPAHRPWLCPHPCLRSSCRQDWGPKQTRCCTHCLWPTRLADLGCRAGDPLLDPVRHTGQMTECSPWSYTVKCSLEGNWFRMCTVWPNVLCPLCDSYVKSINENIFITYICFFSIKCLLCGKTFTLLTLTKLHFFCLKKWQRRQSEFHRWPTEKQAVSCFNIKFHHWQKDSLG